jgi:hypothetical protein
VGHDTRRDGDFHALLDDLRAAAPDQRAKGDRFERLIQAYLTTDPEWTAQFADVWLWSDWSGRNGRGAVWMSLKPPSVTPRRCRQATVRLPRRCRLATARPCPLRARTTGT